jgi:hypothetical protein
MGATPQHKRIAGVWTNEKALNQEKIELWG